MIAQLAHAKGLRVSGHIPTCMTEEAVRAGFDELNHINYLFLNFMDDANRLDTLARFGAAEERHTVVDPTLAIDERLLTARKGAIHFSSIELTSPTTKRWMSADIGAKS